MLEYNSKMQWLLLIQAGSSISQELELVNIDEEPSTEVNNQSISILVYPNTWNLLVLIIASSIVLGYNSKSECEPNPTWGLEYSTTCSIFTKSRPNLWCSIPGKNLVDFSLYVTCWIYIIWY